MDQFHADDSGDLRRESLSGELLDCGSDEEPTYVSPRFRQEYVSNFVAFGHAREESEHSRMRHSSLDASRTSVDVLRELQSKDEALSQLHEELQSLQAKSTEERESLQRELKAAKRLVLDLQHAAKALENANKRITQELQAKMQQVETLTGEVEALNDQLLSKSAAMKDLESACDRMASQWKSERAQLLRELDQHSARQAKEDRAKRLQDIEPLDLTAAKGSPSKGSPSARVRSKSQGKIKRGAKTEDSARGPTTATCRRLLREAIELLGLTQTADLLPELRNLVKKAQSVHACDQFVGQICETVSQLSPPGTFMRQPSLQQVWKWVQRLIDEYMILRKGKEEATQCRHLLHSLSVVMSTPDVVEQAETWKSIEAESRRLLGLSATLTSVEVLAALRAHA